MKIAIVGLGKMGHQIVVKLIGDGHEVVALDQDPEQIKRAVDAGAIGANDRQAVMTAFHAEKPVIWLMIPAAAVDTELEEWKKVLTNGALIIDGGNSDFRNTIKRAHDLGNSSISLMDVGTSGGILGLQNGFSMMVGGKIEDYNFVEPVLKTLSSPSGSYHYFGNNGAGHFVKMVHNSIEYGVMESMAEGFNLLKNGPFENMDLAAVSEVWQHGSIIESSLNSLAAEIFKENSQLDGIEGIVAESGEAKWSLEYANQHDIRMPALQASLDVRIQSQAGQISFATKFLAALRNKFGGHITNPK